MALEAPNLLRTNRTLKLPPHRPVNCVLQELKRMESSLNSVRRRWGLVVVVVVFENPRSQTRSQLHT
jgi:hypothetical protein